MIFLLSHQNLSAISMSFQITNHRSNLLSAMLFISNFKKMIPYSLWYLKIWWMKLDCESFRQVFYGEVWILRVFILMGNRNTHVLLADYVGCLYFALSGNMTKIIILWFLLWIFKEFEDLLETVFPNNTLLYFQMFDSRWIRWREF